MVGPTLQIDADAFSSAWSAFERATHTSETMANTWNQLVDADMFRSNVSVDENGAGRIDVLVDEYEGYRLDDQEQ